MSKHYLSSAAPSACEYGVALLLLRMRHGQQEPRRQAAGAPPARPPTNSPIIRRPPRFCLPLARLLVGLCLLSLADRVEVGVRLCLLRRHALLVVIPASEHSGEQTANAPVSLHAILPKKKQRSRACLRARGRFQPVSPLPPSLSFTHLRRRSRKSSASVLTRCWFSALTNFCHGLRLCLPTRPSRCGSSSMPYLFRYEYRSSVPSTCGRGAVGGEATTCERSDNCWGQVAGPV